MERKHVSGPAEAAAFPATWITIPIFNRREITLGCLENLRRNGVLAWSHVVVCDGGSTDGSVEAVRAEFPEVTVLQGKWWWMEGIRAGMEYAQQHGAEIYVWLNDDCHPRPGSLEALLEHTIHTGHVSGGITHTADGAYSSMRKTRWGLKAMPDTESIKQGEIIEVDSLVGNFVAIPRECVHRIGLPDAKLFPHMCGDSYYTMEAVKGGFRCDLVGSAQADDSHGGNRMDGISILRGKEPLRKIISRHFKVDPKCGILPFLRLSRRFWGFRGYLVALLPWTKDLALIFLRAIIPRSLRLKL